MSAQLQVRMLIDAWHRETRENYCVAHNEGQHCCAEPGLGEGESDDFGALVERLSGLVTSARRDALEEAAKICDAYASTADEWNVRLAQDTTSEKLAAAIRAIKERP